MAVAQYGPTVGFSQCTIAIESCQLFDGQHGFYQAQNIAKTPFPFPYAQVRARVRVYGPAAAALRSEPCSTCFVWGGWARG